MLLFACGGESGAFKEPEQPVFGTPVLPADAFQTATDTTVTIKWEDAIDETTYFVFRQTTNNPPVYSTLAEAANHPSRITKVAASTTRYVDTSLVADTPYYYWVSACTETRCSAPTATIMTRTAPQRVAISDQRDVADITENSAKFVWTAATNATHYKIYRATTNNQSQAAFISNTSAVQYTDSNLNSGAQYFYWIQSCNAHDHCSYFSTAHQVITFLPFGAPRFVSSSSAGNTIDLSWTPVTNAVRYAIYRRNNDTPPTRQGAPEVGGDVITISSTPSYQDNGLSANSTQYYWVQACNNVACSALSASRRAVTTPLAVTNFTATADNDVQVTLNWSAVAGATHYQLFRHIENNQQAATLVSNNRIGTNYQDANRLPNTSYYYWLATCNDAACSTATVAASARTAPPIPIGLRGSVVGQNSITLTWLAVLGAAQYQVFSSGTRQASSATHIATATVTHYTHTKLDDGSNYHWVAACNSEGVCSRLSTPVHNITTLPLLLKVADGWRFIATQDVPYTVYASTSIATGMQLLVSDATIQPAANNPNWRSISDIQWKAIDGANQFYNSSYTITKAGTVGYISRSLYLWIKKPSGEIGNSHGHQATFQHTDPINIPTVADAKNPLLYQQWYVSNRGQNGFAQFNGSASGLNNQPPYSDLNLKDTWQKYGIKGEGVVVSVMDSGLEVAHKDLLFVDVNRSEDYSDSIGGDRDPSPSPTKQGPDHGTLLAGIIAMAEGNGIGGVGVAPRATLVGYNYLSYQTLANMAYALLADVDIVNMSFGFQNTTLIYGNEAHPTATAAFRSGSTKRNGKGIIYIKAAGNSFINLPSYHNNADCANANRHAVSCANASYGKESNIINTIMVAAANAEGVKSIYSTAGPNIWITAFGGDFGRNLAGSGSRYRDGERAGFPALITTDIQGCLGGFSRTTIVANVAQFIANALSVFNYPYTTNSESAAPHPENPNCDFTNTANGTSSAAPVLSGVVALMLQVNPALSWREVKDILARTARMPAHAKTESPEGFILNQGVITNAAGHSFDNWYGFGIVDVDKAVEAAHQYRVGQLGDLQDASVSNSTAVNIPDNSVSGASSGITMDRDLTIEAVQVVMNMEHSHSSDIAIYLVSPSGTKHQLVNHYAVVNSSFRGVRLTSNAFYGERSKGNWRLELYDNTTGNTGILVNWALQVFGR